MKFNNRYTNTIENLDVSDEFKKTLVEKIKKEEYKKGMILIKIRNKIVAILAALGIITCGGVAYATVIPQEWKDNVTNLVNSFFGIESENEIYTGVQEKTIQEVFSSDKENVEKYTQLLDADIYGIGDSNGGTIIETNYDQYNWEIDYNEEGEPIKKSVSLQKYEENINIKIGMINYGCMQWLEEENTVYDENGKVLEFKESTIEEELEYQYNEFTINWDNYYYREEEFNEKLYFKITGMTLMNGNNLTEESYNSNARAKKIKITFNNKQEKIINLLDTNKAQFIDLEYIQYDISKPVNIDIEILETYEGEMTDDVYIADVQFGITSNIPMGI